jgi:hypothetical protein
MEGEKNMGRIDNFRNYRVVLYPEDYMPLHAHFISGNENFVIDIYGKSRQKSWENFRNQQEKIDEMDDE